MFLKAMILWRRMCKTLCKYIHIDEREANRRSFKRSLHGTWMNMLKKGKGSQRKVLQPSLVGNTSLCEKFQRARACKVLIPEWAPESPNALKSQENVGYFTQLELAEEVVLKADHSLAASVQRQNTLNSWNTKSIQLWKSLDPALTNGLNWLCRSWSSTYVRN